MEDSRFLKGELEELKKPSRNLNLNSRGELSKREKLGIFLDSKTFTCVASVCTLGLYYLYYVFCLEQRHDSPFVPSDEGPEKYPYDRPENVDSDYLKVAKMSRDFSDAFEGKRTKDQWRSLIIEELSSFKKKVKFFFTMQICGILGWVERFILYVTKQDIRIDSIEKLRQKSSREFISYEEKLKNFVNKKLKKDAEIYEVEFDLAQSLVTSISGKKIKNKRDHYLTFVFFVTYLLLSIATFGLFPLYHLFIKKRWRDFAAIQDHKEHSFVREFDEITERLVGSSGNLEYSYLLLGKKCLPLNVNFFSDVFKTKIFSSYVARRRIVTLLMLLTFGFFGVFVISRNVLDRSKDAIFSDENDGCEFDADVGRFEKFKFLVFYFFKDINVGIRIAAKRALTINNSFSSLLSENMNKDRVMYKFVKLLSSEFYFWLFSFIYILLSLSLIFIFYAHGFSLWLLVINFFVFLFLFTRHVNLLFS